MTREEGNPQEEALGLKSRKPHQQQQDKANNNNNNKKMNKKKSATQSQSGAGELSRAEAKTRFTNAFHEVRLSPVGNAIVSFVVLAAHGWFLYYLHVEFDAIQDKPSAPSVRNYVDLWVPVFLLSIFSERLYATYKKSDIYYLSDSLSNLGTGSFMILSKKMLGLLVPFFPYIFIWQNYRVSDYFADGGVLAWWIMFVGVEFGYYWAHRTGHTINAFWAMHGIHHSSEEYNLSVALRQSTVHGWFSWIYYLPLAFLFPPSLFLIHSQYNLLYQFWIHTPVVNTLGPLEWILNTPSQHRVHHGKNPYCIDKNYGGTLCIFDRLFGTFQSEIEEIPIVYGTVHPINTFDSLEANVHPWRGIWQAMQSVDGVVNKWRVLCRGPGWIPGSNPPEEYPIPPTSTDSITKYRPILPSAIKAYIVLHFASIIVVQQIVFGFISHNTLYTWVLAGMLFWTYSAVGAICDRKSYAVLLELLRLATIPILGTFALSAADKNVAPFADHRVLGMWLFCVSSALFVWTYRRAITTPLHKKELGDTDYVKAEKDQDLQYQQAGLVPIEPLPATKTESH